MVRAVNGGAEPRFSKTNLQGRCAMWTKPVIVEVAVGLEINCYACADL